MDFDIAVVGLGAMGSAAVRAAAASGSRVVGFDRFAPPHDLGSTHGHTRIIREAYFEHPLYVPLVQRAYDLWMELERESGEQLLLATGGLMVGPAGGELVRGSAASAAEHGLRHEMLDATQIASRFPALRARPDWVALHEHRAGVLFPERCVDALLRGASRYGAELRTGERVLGWRPNGSHIRLETERRTYEVEHLIVAAGPWLPSLRESIGRDLPLVIERQLSHWFEPRRPDDARFDHPAVPIALWDPGAGQAMFATFPNLGHGVKCGLHHDGVSTTPETVDRTVTPAEDSAARQMIESVMPGAGGRRLEARVCLYTNTPDSHFLIDWVNDGRVLLVSPCSGHGFKFASAIGEVAAQFVLDGRTWIDCAPFSLSRFA